MRLPRFLKALVLAFLSATAAADYVDIEGGWHTSPGEANERDTMTIKKTGANKYDVELRTVSCPSTECMNARIGGMSFEAELRDDSLSFTGKGCSVVLHFPELNRADIRVDGCTGEDWLQYGPPRSDFVRFSSYPDWNER